MSLRGLDAMYEICQRISVVSFSGKNYVPESMHILNERTLPSQYIYGKDSQNFERKPFTSCTISSFVDSTFAKLFLELSTVITGIEF